MSSSVYSLLCALFLLAPLPAFDRPQEAPEPAQKLSDGTSLCGTVLTPFGQPAEGAVVALATHKHSVNIIDGRIPGRFSQNPNNPLLNIVTAVAAQNQRENDHYAVTDAAGKFAFGVISFEFERQPGFPPPGIKIEVADYVVCILHESGTRRLSQKEMEKAIVEKQPITLDDWGQVEGTIHTGTKPVKGVKLNFIPHHETRRVLEPHVGWYYNATSNAKGEFVFEKVPTGPGTVTQSILVAKNNYFSSGGTKIDVGDIVPATVKVGGEGRPVIGKLVLDPSLKKTSIEGAFVVQLCRQAEKSSEEENKAHYELYDKVVPESIRFEPDPIKKIKMLDEWETTTEEGKAFAAAVQVKGVRDKNRAYNLRMQVGKLSGVGAEVFREDSFCLYDVPEGKWQLEVSPRDRGIRQMGEPLLIHRFEMPAIPNGVSDDPLDVGTLTLMRLE
jgi:hypothetical protein